MNEPNHCEVGDCREIMRRWIDEGVKVQMCVTSPPYWGLRDYGVVGQLGLEKTPQEYVDNIVGVFRLVRKLLADDGTLWLNLGDSYASTTSGNGGYSEKSTLAGFTSPDTKGRRANETGERRRIESGLKPKDLVGIPWRVAFALQADGWYLRQDIIWSKPNPMPESVRDRCTKSHEYLFLLSKRERYYYDADAILEPVSANTHARLSQDVAAQVGSARAHAGGKTNGKMKAVGRAPGVNPKAALNAIGSKQNASFSEACSLPVSERNKRSVWTVTTQPYADAHFATFPPALIEPCILASSKPGDIVLDPFMGSGTTGQVAQDLGRRWLGCELNPQYAELQDRRTAQQGLML